MNKFIIGDLIYLPQGSYLYSDKNKLLAYTTTSPIVATYLGKEHVNHRVHKIEVYGNDAYVTDLDLERLNFARKDVYKTNTAN